MGACACSCRVHSHRIRSLPSYNFKSLRLETTATSSRQPLHMLFKHSAISETKHLTKKITGYGRTGEVEKAVKVFEQMHQRNQVTWNAMLSVLLDSGRLDSARKLFEEMPQKNSTSYTAMITGFSRSGLVLEARAVFDSIPFTCHNVFSWTAMISCYVQNHEPLVALELFTRFYGRFFELGILPNSHTFSSVLKSCVAIQSLMVSRQIHALISKLLDEECENSIFVQNSLLDLHAKLGNLVDAEGISTRMKLKDLGTWNTMMDGYTHHFLIDKALAIFNSMKERDVLSWNIVMSGLLETGRGKEALSLFLCLFSLGPETKPNPSTYTIVLTICSTLIIPQCGRQIHACTIKNGVYQINIIICNSLISMYASCGLNQESSQVFNEISKKDVVSWNSLILGLGRNGQGREALDIADKALSSKAYNHSTFIAILTSCSHGGLVDKGMDYLSSMRRKYGMEPTLDHYICVVDVLGRAGKIDEAHHVLCHMPFEANSVAWAALLNACVVHDNTEVGKIAAQELQALMPSDISSYVMLANVFARTNRIDESRRLLDLMRERNLRKEPGCSWVPK